VIHGCVIKNAKVISWSGLNLGDHVIVRGKVGRIIQLDPILNRVMVCYGTRLKPKFKQVGPDEVKPSISATRAADRRHDLEYLYADMKSRSKARRYEADLNKAISMLFAVDLFWYDDMIQLGIWKSIRIHNHAVIRAKRKFILAEIGLDDDLMRFGEVWKHRDRIAEHLRQRGSACRIP